MKKILYGTTALAAVGLLAGPVAAAEPLHMVLGGYYQQYFGYSDADKNASGATNINNTTNVQNAEVHFKMRGELDNGLKIGGAIELEGETTGDQIDQSYLTLSGGFGTLRIGAINSGRYSYGWSTDAPDVGLGINSGYVSAFIPPQSGATWRFREPAVSTVIDLTNDNQKLTYFTPRFNGFQFTASWTPDANSTGGSSPFNLANKDTSYTNAFDFGLSYKGEFNGAGVAVQAGIATANAPNYATSNGFDDFLSYNGGISVSFQGFTVAGSFARVDEGRALGCTVSACTGSTQGTSYNAGIGYSTGPWGFSVAYFNGKQEATTANTAEAENEFLEVAASYAIGPGIKTSLSFLNASIDGETAGPSDNNQGNALIWGIKLGF